MKMPRVSVKHKISLPRPKASEYTRPITSYLFFHHAGKPLSETTELILDFPGGGFVSQSPEHHEERLRLWAIKTGKPVLSVDYGKAPECWFLLSQRLPSLTEYLQTHTHSRLMKLLTLIKCSWSPVSLSLAACQPS